MRVAGCCHHSRVGELPDPEKQALLAKSAAPSQSRGAEEPTWGGAVESRGEESWRCGVCQYLNHGAEDKCSMCGVARKEPAVEIPQPVLKKSALGVGMKLKKNEVGACGEGEGYKRNSLPIRRSLGSSVPAERRSEDLFSEVGLGVR